MMEAAVLEDKAQMTESPADGRGHEIEVSDARFDVRIVSLPRRRATGREIIAALGLHDPDRYIVLRYRADGALEDIGLEAEEDLTEPRRNSFFVNASSQALNFTVEAVRLTWTEGRVTGAVVKRLARVDEIWNCCWWRPVAVNASWRTLMKSTCGGPGWSGSACVPGPTSPSG